MRDDRVAPGCSSTRGGRGTTSRRREVSTREPGGLATVEDLEALAASLVARLGPAKARLLAAQLDEAADEAEAGRW